MTLHTKDTLVAWFMVGLVILAMLGIFAKTQHDLRNTSIESPATHQVRTS